MKSPFFDRMGKISYNKLPKKGDTMYSTNDIQEIQYAVLKDVRESLLKKTQVVLEKRKQELNQLIESIHEKEDNLEEKKQFVLNILELCLEVDQIVDHYICNLETIKEKLKRLKDNGDDEKLLNSIFSFKGKPYQEFEQASKEIDFPIPSFFVSQSSLQERIFNVRMELNLCRIMNADLLNQFKDMRKNSYSQSDKIKKIIKAIKEEDYVFFTQEQYDYLVEKSVIYNIIVEITGETIEAKNSAFDYLIDVLNDCGKKYKEQEEKKKNMTFVFESYKPSYEVIEEVSEEDFEEELEEESTHDREEANTWLAMLKEGVEMPLILNTLNLKNDEKVKQCFYESLLRELDFLINDLEPIASLEEKTEVAEEILKYQNYIQEFEDYFMQSDEIEKIEETNQRQNQLIFATTPSGNPCLDPSLSNIQDSFSKQALLKAFKILRYKDSSYIHDHLKQLQRGKREKGLYQYRIYNVRILLRILDENTYFIINTFVKKYNRTNGYMAMLKKSYESTNYQYEILKDKMKEDGLPQEFLNFHDAIYEQIQSSMKEKKY